MESIALIGAHWPGFPKIKHLVIFGASYCDIGYNIHSPHPTLEDPLGVKFPGVTWAEPGEPNWVGHLITEYNPTSAVLVYDFALGGDRVEGVRRQVNSQFLPILAAKPNWAPWTAEDTLFITWVGINDCAWGTDHKYNMENLFSIQEELYEAGGRNFLFINVPPINRSPAAGKNATRSASYQTWNLELRSSVIEFSKAHSDLSAMIFSSWETFTRVLDDPTAHGFLEEDVRRAGGAIWVDQLHPTSRMHRYIARDLSQFLNSQDAHKASG